MVIFFLDVSKVHKVLRHLGTFESLFLDRFLTPLRVDLDLVFGIVLARMGTTIGNKQRHHPPRACPSCHFSAL